MKTLPRFLALAAASAIIGVGVLGASRAAADPYYDNGPANGPGYGAPGWSDNGYDRPRYYNPGYNGPAYDGPGYDRPGAYAYGGPGYVVGSGVTAVCPPDYHLGRSGRLCWPD